jgi:lysine 2,3-aminomutase
VGDPTQTFSRSEFDAQIEYIENTPQVRDVLLSGGDPMVLAPKLLEMILSRLRAIPHVEIIRIGSRVPVFLPMRVTQEFADMVSKYHPFWLNIHVNHPKEITPELAAAADRLTRAGVPLGNQSVLLAGINDSVTIQRKLVHELVKIRVRPYYLYQCDLVEGAGHLRTSVSKGIEIMEGLRGHTSGYAVPTYVVDAPGGGGKIPVAPNYVLSQGPDKVVLRNFEGFITTYSEPEDYDPHAIKAQEALIAPRPEPGQEGITALLDGHRMAIEPEGFGDVHARGGAEHRLRSGELKKKWQPLGVGAVESEAPQLEEGSEE